MPDLGTAYVQIVPSADGIKARIQEILGDNMPSGEEHGKTYASGLVSAITGAIAAAGIGVALKSALTEGAALEQSLGGVETLFKDAADTVIANAKRAYQEAGVSANTYMENVTSFAASLISGLGGDTERAAEIANTAMIDMADNANKMGTNIVDIQNAYQGFAKQNFDMLDNLKLGYGGTQSEMIRLINDSGILNDTISSLDGITFDQMIEAIHAVQENLGIAGATSQEAATTLSGSFGAMKAAAQDFAGHLTLGMDVTPAVQNMVSTAATFLFANLIPALGNIITALPGAINTLIVETGNALAQNLGSGFAAGIPQMIEQALPLMLRFSENIRENAGQMVDAGLELVMQLAQGVINSIPMLIAYIPQIVTNIAGIINDNAPKLLTTGLEIIGMLASGLIQAIPALIANIPQIIQAIVAVFSAFNWWQLGNLIVNGVRAGAPALGNALKSLAQNAIDAFKSINWASAGSAACSFIRNAVSGAAGLIANALRSIGTQGMNAFRSINWASVGRAAVNFIKNAISGAAGLVVSGLRAVGTRGMQAFTGINWASVGKQIINGIVRGISGAASALFNALRNLASSALDSAKRFLGIASPSKLFRDSVGKWIPEGIAVGITTNADSVQESIDKLIDLKRIGLSGAFRPLAAASGRAPATVTYYQTINSPKAMSRREIRRETRNVVRELSAYV